MLRVTYQTIGKNFKDSHSASYSILDSESEHPTPCEGAVDSTKSSCTSLALSS